MKKNINIAIDGPAGSGKSTVASLVAERLGLIHLDTGAMYRAIGYKALEENVDTADVQAVEKMLAYTEIIVKYDDKKQHIFVDGKDVTPCIRTNEVSHAASVVAAIPAVRLKLVELQREIADKNPVILDGREIGSFVLPDADVKVFLTASVRERARRRLNELHAKGKELDMTLDMMVEEISTRDYKDSHREFAPLTVAQGATVIDSTNMTLDDVCEKIVKLAEVE